MFGRRLRRHRAGARDLAGEFRVTAHERHLLVRRRAAERRHHRVVQGGDGRERPCREGGVGDPGGMFEHRADGGGKARRGRRR